MAARRMVALICLVVLTGGLSACGQTRGATYQPNYNGDIISVNQADVISSRKVTYQGFMDLLERMEGDEYRPLAKSHLVSRQQSCQNHWYRVVYCAFPKFSGEITGPGARRIKQYYKKQYQSCAAEQDFPWLDKAGEIADTPAQAVQYRLQVYAVNILDDYVVVDFYAESYTGGGLQVSYTADVFNRNSGEKQSLGDMVNLDSAADAINTAVADYLRTKDIRPFTPYDVRQSANQMFSRTEDGLVLLFAPGTLAPSVYGTIKVPVNGVQ